MRTIKVKNYCRQLKDLINRFLVDKLMLDRHWVRNHIANCPRCQRRVMLLGKVELAISLLKSQPHRLDLLMRANTQAIGVLKHSLRTTTKARLLRNVRPEPGIFERCARYKRSFANAAACIAIAVLLKSGAFSSAQVFESKGRKAVEHYYASQAGEDIARDIFTKQV
jgi:anti-sigma factor RsiW